METYYLRALIHWWKHRDKPPRLIDIADLCRRSGRPGSVGHQALVSRDWPSPRAVRRGLLALEDKGYVRRKRGKFEVIR